MTNDEQQTTIQQMADIKKAFEAKGYTNVDCTFRIELSTENQCLNVDYKDPVKDFKWESLWFNENTFSECVLEAYKKLSNIPNLQDRERAKFQEALRDLISKGETLGINVDAINPLQELAKNLATNALTFYNH